MKEAGFGGRKNELEEKFFREKDQELIQAMREKTATFKRKQALAEASGIEHDHLLDQLDEMNVTSETLTALSLVPLIAVAWADGKLDDKERAAVLAAAEQAGLEPDHPGHELLKGWLKQKPDEKLYAAWEHHVEALSKTLNDEAREALRADLVGRARTVAEATGGILGLGSKVSREEHAALDRLEAAFG